MSDDRPNAPGVERVEDLDSAAEVVRVTFVLWDADTDGVAVKHNGEVVWRERSWDRLDQYVKFSAPLGVPVIFEWEVNE